MTQEKWLVDGPKVIDVENVRRLKVSLVRGQVNVVGHDEPGARVEVHSVSGKPIKVAVEGDTLVVDHPQVTWDNFIDVFRNFGWKSGAMVDVSIMVPRDVALKFGVVSASALISGLTADSSVSSVSGDLVLDSMSGSLDVNSVSGEISVRDFAGKVSAHTVSGEVTVSGDITKLTTDTVSGGVFLDVTGIPDQIRLNTVSGDITTRLAPGVPAQYTINTVGGRIQLDDAEITGTVRGSYSGKYGELDKHWLEFRANTVGGNISVLHSVSA